MTPGEMEKRLDAISEDHGVPYGRVHELFDAESVYGNAAIKYKGYLALSDAFKSFFLETTEELNFEIRLRTTKPLSEFSAVTRAGSCFSAYCMGSHGGGGTSAPGRKPSRFSL